MFQTLEVSHLVMFSLNEVEFKTFPSHQDSALHVANTLAMFVTRLVSQRGMSSHPAAPHRAELGSAQFGSVEQHFHPVMFAPRQFLIAVLSASLSANGAASAPGMRVQPTTHNATSARDREIRIPGLDRLRGARGGAFQRRREDFWTSPKIARNRPLPRTGPRSLRVA